MSLFDLEAPTNPILPLNFLGLAHVYFGGNAPTSELGHETDRHGCYRAKTPGPEFDPVSQAKIKVNVISRGS